MDLTNKSAVQIFFQNNLVHACIHTAAYTAVDAAESHEELARNINSHGTTYLARECAKVDALFICISTDFVFDGAKNTPYTEDDAPNPLSVYGKTKLEGERPHSKNVIRRLLFVPHGCIHVLEKIL